MKPVSKVRMTVDFDEDVYEKLAHEAYKNRITKRSIISKALEDYFAKNTTKKATKK